MPFIAKPLFFIAACQLIHSAFSSFEFHQLRKQIALNNPKASLPSLPNDIIFETICGVLIFWLATMLSYEKNQFLTVRGKNKMIYMSEYLQPIAINKASNIDILRGSDPFGEINYHPSFLDIHAKRKEMREYLNKK